MHTNLNEPLPDNVLNKQIHEIAAFVAIEMSDQWTNENFYAQVREYTRQWLAEHPDSYVVEFSKAMRGSLHHVIADALIAAFEINKDDLEPESKLPRFKKRKNKGA